MMGIVVFLDRDGTISKEVDNLRSLSQLRILPHAADAIRRLNELSAKVIIITNQPVVARGWITEREVEEIHKELSKRLAKKNARIDAIYYCPHHPQANDERFRKECTDRKPNIGLIKKAVKDHGLSLDNAYFIGDMTVDIQTAVVAKITPILVKTGYGGQDKKYDAKPSYVAKNLFDAVNIIEKLNTK